MQNVVNGHLFRTFNEYLVIQCLNSVIVLPLRIIREPKNNNRGQLLPHLPQESAPTICNYFRIRRPYLFVIYFRVSFSTVQR